MPEIRYGEAVAVSPRARRVTAPNSGRMTGPGTNTYLIGERELAMVDPGPNMPEHVDALERICVHSFPTRRSSDLKSVV